MAAEQVVQRQRKFTDQELWRAMIVYSQRERIHRVFIDDGG